ncbi:hypothetical protein PA598K_00454 [Paenibacillus sp. 598K]|uniref:(2Fe-2S)-binding protein n=1 Tax=Paenibacillus sp. 598K TaxID=1117987 RepID=UPI000FF919C3|nr:(2Fe-2S)-binding protein [Paenibacillus sp. 598K]GBF72216.1 hypothetical protein PA598K_00454 [Paenibacillus sp. 598K]
MTYIKQEGPGGSDWQGIVNGEPVRLRVRASQRLLSLLREELGLTGVKLSCGIGRCGACTVLVDDRPVNACLAMAYQCAGKRITTIEGLVDREGKGKGELHPIQRALIEEGGFQCGYCTPGMTLAVKALLDEHPTPTSEQTLQALSGNLCRCTGYGGILRAVERCARGSGLPDG